MKLTFVLGTRPELIKLAPVIFSAKARKHDVVVVSTGQHRDMLRELFQFFKIKPDIELDVMTPNQTLPYLSAKILEKLTAVQNKVLGDALIVQGDTTSAWCAAYFAFCNHVPVVHVEAGLRTYNLNAPFPEEANRQLISRIADIHFAPTLGSARNLKKELHNNPHIFTVGNTSIDSLKWVLNQIQTGELKTSYLPATISKQIEGKKIILVTAHRRESFGEGFENICHAIQEIVSKNNNVCVVFPVHPNPNVREPVEKYLLKTPNVFLCDPLPYGGFIELMKRADIILTDSGGVQEEAPTLKKPIIVMRESTERPEGVRAGYSKLAGTNSKKIVKLIQEALKKGCQGKGPNPYGDGKSSDKMIRLLERLLSKKNK